LIGSIRPIDFHDGNFVPVVPSSREHPDMAGRKSVPLEPARVDYLVSGGTTVGTTISGGTLEVTSGATGGNVTFASGGILQLDSLIAFGGTISDFTLGDPIDLRGLAYTSGTTNLSWTQLTTGANASGTLTVSSGATVETLTLLGQYTAANFSATSDGVGGTLITDPPASSSAIQTPLAAQH
jgi:hypothetical protein